MALFSQVSLTSIEEDYFNFLQLKGELVKPTLGYKTLSDNKWDLSGLEENEEHIWKNNNLGTVKNLLNSKVQMKIYGPEWFNSVNTTSPFGQNDGALWQGRGYNTSLTGGLRLESYGFELTFKPQITFNQNLSFEILPSAYENKFGYFSGYGNGIGIDKPQRFGDSSFWAYDLGDSEIRFSWHNFTLGFGTQTIWLGPAYKNPMLHSNNAPSYPKFDLGIRKQKIEIPGIHWNAGLLESRIWIGQLQESDYFDSIPENNKRMIAGFTASFAPSFIPGFTLGVNKICVAQWTKESWKYLNPFFDENSIGEGKDKGEDQKMSVTVDWFFPQVGFELFGEGAWDDYTSSIISNPFHTFTYSLGFKQILNILPKSKLNFELICEINNLEMSQDFQLQWAYLGLYTHGGISQGYTNKGQTLGNGTSIGGNSQYVSLNIYHPKYVFTAFFHRFCPDINYVLSKAVYFDASHAASDKGVNSISKDWYSNYETFIGGGAELSYFITPYLNLSSGFSCLYINKPLYKSDESSCNFNISTKIKIIF